MKIDFGNLVKYLIDKMPELKDAPGYDESDNDNPYVAFASFSPFVKEKKERLLKFLKIIDDIYINTKDPKVTNLIGIEIFDGSRDMIDDEIMESVFSKKTRNDFYRDKEVWLQERKEFAKSDKLRKK